LPKPTIYVETTFVSYLTAWPSRNVIRAADQLITHEWWDTQRERFDLFTSELVILEASAGDPNAAEQRLAVLGTLPIVDTGPEAGLLATTLIAALAVPATESRDALHIATAAMNGIDYILTWNCTHLPTPR
jgi:predicted nucleic acid-binding protein